jgi:hypothetical protein
MHWSPPQRPDREQAADEAEVIVLEPYLTWRTALADRPPRVGKLKNRPSQRQLCRLARMWGAALTRAGCNWHLGASNCDLTDHRASHCSPPTPIVDMTESGVSQKENAEPCAGALEKIRNIRLHLPSNKSSSSLV